MNNTLKTFFFGASLQYYVEKEIKGSYIASALTEKFYITPLDADKTDMVNRMIALKALNRLNGTSEDRVLWPTEIIEDSGSKWCVLKIRNYSQFTDCTASLHSILTDNINVKPAILYKICTAVTELYSLLSNLGLYFNIFSLDDILFNLKNGDVCIKNTHMLLSGSQTPAEIAGTPLLMAPETIEGTAGINRFTNIYSCMTFLFCLMFRMHPLHGAKRRALISETKLPDNAAIRDIYGYNAEFCFGNGSDVHAESAVALSYKEADEKVMELFTRLYTEGIKNFKSRDDLKAASNIFGEACKKYPVFKMPVFNMPKPVIPEPLMPVIQINPSANFEYDAREIIIKTPCISSRMKLSHCSSIQYNTTIVPITERNGSFYLKNTTPVSFNTYQSGTTMNSQLVPGYEIRLTNRLIIEIPGDNNNNTVLKFI